MSREDYDEVHDCGKHAEVIDVRGDMAIARCSVCGEQWEEEPGAACWHCGWEAEDQESRREERHDVRGPRGGGK